MDRVGSHVKAMPQLQSFLNIQTEVLVRFSRWDDILKLPPPDAKSESRENNVALRPRHGVRCHRKAYPS